jgi:NHL repeat/WD40-like Beta Propeller Repeat
MVGMEREGSFRLAAADSRPQRMTPTTGLSSRHISGPAARVAGCFAAILAAAAIMALLGPVTAAQALATHAFFSSFGTAGSTAGQLSSPGAVAVNEATGDVYVADTGNARIDQFDSSGTFVRAWGWGVADGAASFETCTLICQAGVTGSGPGQFETPSFISVDNGPSSPSNGDVYVADTGDNLVQKFDSAGNQLAAWGDGGAGACGVANGQLSGGCATDGPFGPLAGIAVDDTGNLWVYDQNHKMFEFAQDASFSQDWNSQLPVTAAGIGVDSSDNLYVAAFGTNLARLTSSGSIIGEEELPNVTGVAATPSSTDVYVDDGSLIHHFSCGASPGCMALDAFGAGHFAAGAGLVANSATNTVYAVDASADQVDVFTSAVVPDVTTKAASNATAPDATLNGTVNPDGTILTDCHFEYGLTNAYGKTAPCVPAAGAIPADSNEHSVTADITGLSLAIYHFRLVAANAQGENAGTDQTFRVTTHYPPTTTFAACPNDALRTGDGASLPDCRAFEQATPIDKDGTNPEGEVNAVQASPSGDAITFTSQSGVPGGVGASTIPQFVARRGSESWSTAGLLPPEQYGQHAIVIGRSLDQRYSVSQDQFFGEGTALVRRDTVDNHVDVIVPATTGEATYSFAGISADDSKVYFEGRGQTLTPDAAEFANNLYVWDAASDKISLVGVLPGGGAPPSGSFAGPYEWLKGKTGAGGASSTLYTIPTHAISEDGGRAYFTAAGTGQLYLRQNATAADASTVQVSASKRTTPDPNGPRPAAFLAATPDGSVAFFKSSAELTDNANTGPADNGSDLYAYDAASGALTDLTADSNPADPSGAEVQGVLGASDDGAYAYFVANGVLATNTGANGSSASAGNCKGTTSGSCNLYLWHAGRIVFISRLTATGTPQTSDGTNWEPIWKPGNVPYGKTARVTPDGKTLLFRSSRPLTKYQPGCEVFGEPCAELYRYSAGAGDLNCVSCNPTGAAATTQAKLQTQKILSLITIPTSGILTRNLSADGSRVFFESTDPLVEADTNGTGGCKPFHESSESATCQDVYEWEADGSGSCHSTSQNGGCIYLLSSGQSDEPAYFADASASGDRVFIFTPRPEVPVDEDHLYDIYDLAVDGGLASQHRTTPPSCQGEACHPPPSTPPAAPAAASVSFTGAGNVKPGAPSSGTASGKVRVLNSTVRGASFLIMVNVPGSGRITITGAGVGSARMSVLKAGTFELRVTLTGRNRRLLAHRHKVTVRLRVGYQPADGAASAATVTLTARPNRRAQASRAITRTRRVGR